MRFILALFIILTSLPVMASEKIVIGRASVIDGDTIDIHGTRIRIWGIDAPESKQLCKNSKGKSYRCGQQAALALAKWLDKSQPIKCVSQYYDRYKRIVAKCARSNGDDIGKWLARNGYALDWSIYSKGFYSKDQTSAQKRKAGIWQGSFQKPWQWRKKH